MSRPASFFVPGECVAWRVSTQTGRGRAYKSPELKRYQEKVVLFARAAWRGKPLTCGVALEMDFVLPRPPKTKLNRPGKGQGDLTNLYKATEDALTGLAYRDDSQVCRAEIQKRWVEPGEEVGVLVRVEKIGE